MLRTLSSCVNTSFRLVPASQTRKPVIHCSSFGGAYLPQPQLRHGAHSIQGLLPSSRRQTGQVRGFHVACTAEVSLKNVSVKEAKQMMDSGATYLDVRTEQEFEAGHAPGAINVPFMLTTVDGLALNQSFISEVKKQLSDKHAEIVVGCKMGKRSEMAVKILEEEHYSNLNNVTGGFDAWSAQGLPTDK
ncbi:hypothetical protein WJX72_003623 [[Myrmecia] bisecta]|uniref:Rhodanese domain-containing protein n=1 Tax=[Myrmecia] bisecta TaxID=41462 RepID=A0AAW1R640_9CHLO